MARASARRTTCLVALRGDAVLGYGSLVWRSQYPPFVDEGRPEIQDLVVSKSWRGQGTGTALIAALEARVRAAGRLCVGIGFGLYADYGSAQKLYVRLGYQPDGRGVTYENRPVTPGGTVWLDDELVLWLVKGL